MDITVFPPAELTVALGAIRAVEPDPQPAHDHFIEVLARLHAARVDPRALPSPTPAQTAEAIIDPHRRKRLLQLAMVMTTVDGVVDEEPAASVAALAAALGVNERGVRTLHRMALHHDTLARMDMARRVGKRMFGLAWREERWSGVRKVLSAAVASGVEDAELARKYNRLGLLPAGTFGRELWEHWVSRDFGMPGQKNGIPEIAVFHDVGHVLSGYDTDPHGEIQQAAFQAGFVRDDGFMFLFFGIAQFHLGMRITPIAEAEVGFLDIEKVMVALARGAACKVDLSDGWDLFAHAEKPLEEVRRELGIPPLS
jgi:hypothetical protein